MSQAERYIALQKRTERNHDSLDSSYHAAFYLLSGDADICKVAKGFISHEGIDFEGLIDASKCHDLSEVQHQLLDIAFNLFSWTSEMETAVTPHEVSRMGHPYMELVCNAIYIASGGYAVRIRRLERNRPAIELDTSRHEHAKQIFESFDKAQEEAMQGGSMFGWDTPAARPWRYDQSGNPRRPAPMINDPTR